MPRPELISSPSTHSSVDSLDSFTDSLLEVFKQNVHLTRFVVVLPASSDCMCCFFLE